MQHYRKPCVKLEVIKKFVSLFKIEFEPKIPSHIIKGENTDM